MVRTKGPMKTEWKENMVYLYQFPRTPHIPNLSPYCLKLETWLRMAQIPYEICETVKAASGPEGTLPFIELNGKQISDSDITIRELTHTFSKEGLESAMDDRQSGIARAVERMVEDSMIRSFAYSRYHDHVNELFSQEILGPNVPHWMISKPVRMLFQRRIIGRLQAHGIGRHPKEEIIKTGLEDMRALSKILGNNQFFGGNKPARVDCTVFGHLAQMLYIPIKNEHQDLLNSDECKNLRAFCNRMKDQFWADWDEFCEAAKTKKQKEKGRLSFRKKKEPVKEKEAPAAEGEQANGEAKETEKKQAQEVKAAA